MKRIVSLVIALSLIVSCAFAAGETEKKNASALQEAVSAVEERFGRIQGESEEKYSMEPCLINLFVEFGIQIREASFRQIDNAVSSFEGYCERTAPTSTEFGEHHLIDENGFELTMAYMPIDSSFDSKDFGNVDKEILYSVSLSRGDKSITMSNSMHTQEIAFLTYSADRSMPNKTVNSIDELLDFFKKEMDGVVPEALRNVGTPISISQRIKTAVEHRSKEYTECKVTDIVVSMETNSDPIRYIVSVYIEYGLNNSLDKTQEMVDIYSDDMAAYLAQTYDSLSEIYVFCTLPKYFENNMAAKCSYHIHDEQAFIADKIGLLYQNTAI